MFRVELNSSKDELAIFYAGHVTSEQTQLCAAEVERAAPILFPGFRLIVDLTGLESMDISCLPFIAKIMEACNAAGIAEVVRIIPDPARDIGLQIMSFFHYGNDVYIRTCASNAEANELLAKETA